MSTHAIIAKVSREDGTTRITATGVHNDGDPGATGWLLHHYYSNEADIDHLLANDYLSSLGTSPEARTYQTPPQELLTLISPAHIPGYRDVGDTKRMMDSDWSRRIHPHWVYVRDGGQWLACRPGADLQPLAEVLAEHDEPVMWNFVDAEGRSEYRNKGWVLANIRPPV